MARERFIIKTGNNEIAIPKTDLISLEVELDTEMASMFRLRLAIRQQRNLWTHLDDARFRVWTPITISAGFDTSAEELLSGYITHVKPDFPHDIAQCNLEIWGMDHSVLMDREEKLRAWPNEKDSTIASHIFSLYGFSSVVEETQVIHDEDISTIIQRETDMQFLKRLALRNGFECYFDGATGFFQPPRLNGASQPVLAVHFGKRETNMNRFSLEVNALTPANVAMFQTDRTNKSILEATIVTSQQKALGASNATELLARGVAPGQVYVSMNATTGAAEMAILSQELFHQAEWFVTAEGEIDGNHYEHVLKPRRTVTIKGVGETHSGVYYVTHVTHAFTPSGYSQFFRAKRNALRPTGTEDFSTTAARGNRLL